MAQIRFDQLIEALAGAVVEAEQVVRRNQIAGLRTFFDRDNRPVSVHIRLPSIRPSAKPGEEDELKVPLLNLINAATLTIKELDVEFSTDLGEITDLREQTPHAMSHAEMAADERMADGIQPSRSQEISPDVQQGWSGTKTVHAVNVSAPAAAAAQSPNWAKVTLRVRGVEPPEGLARLIDRLNKAM